ncbi:MAG: murein transglycosylase A [Rhizobiaceae bacterium]|nr:murein transglycosylase A [Rhizobiaceae bacterium]MCV0404674.1 murein transglycosylase A [Rhizobiaceae bacterium]
MVATLEGAAPIRRDGALVPTRFADLPGWEQADFVTAFGAFRLNARQSLHRRYRAGSIGASAEDLEPAWSETRDVSGLTRREARDFFERHFRPAFVRPEGRDRGFVTGYYEPIVEASPVRTARHRVPLLARPPDLVDLDAANRPADMDSAMAFGRRDDAGRLVEYWDRAAIDRGALEGRGLEIAWLENRVEAYFIHVQGAARLVFPDGRTIRVTYAAKSGHPFTGAGQVLIELGELRREDVTMRAIRDWLADNPHRVDEILWRNRSYIFFREAPVDDPAAGPVAAAKVPLTAGCSVAVDRLLHTFSTPFFIVAPSLTAIDGRSFSRLMIAQDTGSAILGPARADLFIGSGHEAGEIAGAIRHDADFFVLLPKASLP